MKAIKTIQIQKAKTNIIVIASATPRLRSAPPSIVFQNKKRKNQLLWTI